MSKREVVDSPTVQCVSLQIPDDWVAYRYSGDGQRPRDAAWSLLFGAHWSDPNLPSGAAPICSVGLLHNPNVCGSAESLVKKYKAYLTDWWQSALDCAHRLSEKDELIEFNDVLGEQQLAVFGEGKLSGAFAIPWLAFSRTRGRIEVVYFWSHEGAWELECYIVGDDLSLWRTTLDSIAESLVFEAQ